MGSIPAVASDAIPGATLWAKRYDGPGHGIDTAHALVVSPDGAVVFVTGESSGSTVVDFGTVAYDASTGARLWVDRYAGPGNGPDIAHAIGVSPDGSEVFVTGASGRPNGPLHALTVAYDASTGARRWVKPYNPGNGLDAAYALGVSPDGAVVFVTGESHGSTSGRDYATVAYDTSTGAQLWVRRYNGSGNGSDAASALGVSADGSEVFVTGASLGSDAHYRYATVAYDASTGARLWLKRYSGPAHDYDSASALGVSPDGSEVFVTGTSYGSTVGGDYATVAYDASTGAQLWATRYDGPLSGIDIPYALGVNPDGTQVFVTGEGDGFTGSGNYATVAYDTSTGAQLWVKRYDGPANNSNVAYALGVSPDGTQVFVTGQSDTSTGAGDYATVAYDASTGATRWAERYDGPGHDVDFANALGVSPDGSCVFVTGQSDGSTGIGDYATVAYGVA